MSNSRIRYTRAQVQARAVEIDLNVVISDVIFPSMPVIPIFCSNSFHTSVTDNFIL